MPRKLSRMQRLHMTIGGALCTVAVLPGAALAAECPVAPTTKPFAQFGDMNDYSLAPGGDFESLSWIKVGRVGLADGNEPYFLAPGVKSLKLDRVGEAVTSDGMCVDRTMPHLRFVGQGDGQLNVTVAVSYPSGATDTSTTIISPSDHRYWAPSRYVDLKTGAIPAGESATATVTFESRGWWLIDNVFLDPYRR